MKFSANLLPDTYLGGEEMVDMDLREEDFLQATLNSDFNFISKKL